MIDLRALRKEPEKYRSLILKKDSKFTFYEFYIRFLLDTEYNKFIEEARSLKKEITKMIYNTGEYRWLKEKNY